MAYINVYVWKSEEVLEWLKGKYSIDVKLSTQIYKRFAIEN